MGDEDKIVKPDYTSSDYYKKRKHLAYYREAIEMANRCGGKSVIDIGCANVPLLDGLRGFKRRVAIDTNLLPKLREATCIRDDFLRHSFREKFDLGVCLQVLEHTPDPKKFAHKIFDLCDTVILSVPYKWPRGACKTHLHDPIDEKKLFAWTGRKPTEMSVVDGRLIAAYKPKKKVLIVVISKEKIGKECLAAIANQDYENFSVLQSIQEPDKSKSKAENIIIHRNIARRKALKTDADYFFLVDSDVILPKNALSNLMLQLEQPRYEPKMFANLQKMFGKCPNPKKKIIGGWYKLTRTLWSPSRWVADNTIASLKKVEQSVVIVDKIALGCILMAREVLQRIKFRLGQKLNINGYNHPCMCTMFGIDAQDAGYTLYMDGSVVCKHLLRRCR